MDQMQNSNKEFQIVMLKYNNKCKISMKLNK